MSTSAYADQLPARLLFLCKNESAVRMDTKSLRSLGITKIYYTANISGALKHLSRKANSVGTQMTLPAPADVIVCDEQLADAPASVFLYALTGHSDLNRMPVLVMASEAKSARLYRSAGVCVLERPYTPDQLGIALKKAISLAWPLDAALFEEAGKNGLCLRARERPVKATAAKPVTTTDLYKQGMELLKRHECEAAREMFQKVLARQEDHLEACLALARTYQGENNTEGVRHSLVRAAAVCLRNKDTNRASLIASMLPAGMRENIFAQEALVRMLSGEYRAAALSFLEAGKHKPDQPLHAMIARACLLTTRPEAYMSQICEALEGLGYKPTASELRRRLLEYPELRGTAARSSWLDRYPRLKEVVSVASYAAWAWKQA